MQKSISHENAVAPMGAGSQRADALTIEGSEQTYTQSRTTANLAEI